MTKIWLDLSMLSMTTVAFANSIVPDPTALEGAVRSGSTLFNTVNFYQ